MAVGQDKMVLGVTTHVELRLWGSKGHQSSDSVKKSPEYSSKLTYIFGRACCYSCYPEFFGMNRIRHKGETNLMGLEPRIRQETSTADLHCARGSLRHRACSTQNERFFARNKDQKSAAFRAKFRRKSNENRTKVWQAYSCSLLAMMRKSSMYGSTRMPFPLMAATNGRMTFVKTRGAVERPKGSAANENSAPSISIVKYLT